MIDSRVVQTSLSSRIARPLKKLGLAVAKQWPWPVAASLPNGRRMFVDLRSPVGRGIYVKGEFDPAVFEPLRSVLREGDTFLDIGANVGYYSMLALDAVGPTGRVYAFEIDERPLRCLRRTKAKQQLHNLHINGVAVGDHTGTAILHQEHDSGHSHLAPGHAGRRVPITTLDEWMTEAKPPHVRAVKMDIEGAEMLALRGASRFITQHRPVWVCEAWDSDSGTNGAVGGFLCEFGYRVEPLRNAHSPAIIAWPT